MNGRKQNHDYQDSETFVFRSNHLNCISAVFGHSVQCGSPRLRTRLRLTCGFNRSNPDDSLGSVRSRMFIDPLRFEESRAPLGAEWVSTKASIPLLKELNLMWTSRSINISLLTERRNRFCVDDGL